MRWAFLVRHSKREVTLNTTTWLLADEAAEYMRMHRITVYRLLQRGELQGKKVGKHWHIRTDWCDAYLMGETV